MKCSKIINDNTIQIDGSEDTPLGYWICQLLSFQVDLNISVFVLLNDDGDFIKWDICK